MESNRKKGIKIIVVAVPALIVVVFMALVGAAVYDVIRPVQPVNIHDLGDTDYEKEITSKSSPSSAKRSPATSATLTVASNATASTSTTLAGKDEDLVPVNMFVLPEMKIKARTFNEKFRVMVHDLASFREKGKGMGDKEKLKQLSTFYDQYYALQEEFFRNYQKYYERSWKRLGGIREEISHLQLEYYVGKGDWLVAAECARKSGWENSWELERLYLSRSPDGKLRIALRSYGRNWEALKRSFLSIGPDFQWPHHENWD